MRWPGSTPEPKSYFQIRSHDSGFTEYMESIRKKLLDDWKVEGRRQPKGVHAHKALRDELYARVMGDRYLPQEKGK